MRLIDADALLNGEVYYDRAECLVLRYEIEKAPTVDAVEVVRCKDCRHADNECLYGLVCNMFGAFVSGDDFCSSGRRRE